MAWDPIAGGGYSGDDPMDAFATALARIAGAYVSRFGRRPTRHELAHAFNMVLEADPERYVDDPDPPDSTSAPRSAVLPDDFVASEGEEADPNGRYFVARKDDGADVLQCSLELEGRVLRCRYRTIDAGLTDTDARALIVSTILQDLTDGYFADKADRIWFAARGGDEGLVVPYPR
jgi:hypothetical protein